MAALLVVGAHAAVEVQRVELVVISERQARGVQRQLEVVGREVRNLVVPEQQLLAGGVVESHVGAHLGHGRLHLGERHETRIPQSRHVEAGLEVGDDVVPAAGPHDENVGARAAGEDVVPAGPVQGLRAVPARQDVVLGVALAVGQVVGEGEVLDIGAERVGHRSRDGVDAFAGVLHHHVARVIDGVAVVALAPDQGVAAAIASEAVVRGRADQGLGCLGSQNAMRRRAAKGQLNARGVQQVLHCHLNYPLFTEDVPRAGLSSADDRDPPTTRAATCLSVVNSR